LTHERAPDWRIIVTKQHALREKSAIALAVSSILAGGTHAAHAQDTPSATTLGEVVVTATRREESIQDIPFNISAVSGEALEKANIIDSVEALRTMAGVSIQDRGYRNTGMGSSITIRGINVDTGSWGDVPLAAVPTVATYVDNMALYGNFILKDVERVEVLRGPQGTLYGSGSLAGNVRYIMKKPELGGFNGTASVAFGQTDGSDGYNLNPDIMLNIPVSDTFALRMNAGLIDNDGIVDYPHVYVLDANGKPVVNGDVLTATPEYRSVEDADDVDIKYGRVSALFAPTDTFSAQLSYQYQKDEIGGRRQVTSGDDLVNGGQYGDYDFGAIQLEPSEREVELAALEMEIDLGFATLTSSTSYYDHTGTGISDNSGVYAHNRWFRFYGSSPRPMAQAERFYDDSAVTQELRLVSNGENKVDWTVGAYYTDQDSDLGQNSYLVGYIPYLNAYPYGCAPPDFGWYCIGPYTTEQDFLFRRNQDYKETAVYGEFTINFTEDVHLTLGGRYFDNEIDVDALVDVPIYAVFAPPGVASESDSDSDFLVKANLAWDVTDESMLYATFSQGYRHGGSNAVPTTGKYGESPDYFVFAADTIDNYEIGYKGTSGRLNYAVDVYYADWKDPQLNTSTSNWGFFGVINGESARTQGFEVELSGNFTDALSYSLGYTYADGELTADVYQPAGNFYGTTGRPVFLDLTANDGDRLPGTAKHVFNLTLRHDMELANGMEMSTVLSGYYQSDVLNSIGDDNCLTVFSPTGVCRDSPSPTGIFGGGPNPFYAPTSIWSRNYAEVDSFQIWNLSTTLSKDAWSASVFVKNVFNEEGTTGVFTFTAAGSSTIAENNYYGNNSRDYIALPRTIGLSLGYRF
jgi:outer membrane receptor protein involved in Fe transport